MIILKPFLFNRVISPSLSPNTERDDVLEALRLIVKPWAWRRGEAVCQVEQWFSSYFETDTVVTFNSGRSALFALLQSFGVGQGDEVLTQAFSCVAVPNSVLWAGAKPVYVDIDESFNLDPADAEKKLTKRTKAIIVQHTFGIPADMDSIMPFVKEHQLILIEDCAHSLGSMYKGRRIGTFGDAAFFSFGRDKVLSSVWGGLATLNIKYQRSNIKTKFMQYQNTLPVPGNFWIYQQLLHPLAFSIILSSYNWAPLLRRFNNRRKTETATVGKILLYLLQKVHLLSVPVYQVEKFGGRPAGFPAQYPNALAILLLRQLFKLDRYTQRRKETARYYRSILSGRSNISLPPHVPGASYLRFSIRVNNPQALMKYARSLGILLGNWYHNVIDPKGVSYSAISYKLGSCPKAEQYAREVVNLPTLVTAEQAERVIMTIEVGV